MSVTPSLGQYVNKITGLPLGAKGSLSQMLQNSLGAKSIQEFWLYWNPIWGFYLRFYCFKPLKKILPIGLARLFTFIVSGGLHDIAILAITGRLQLICTTAFLIIGIVTHVSSKYRFNLASKPFGVRACVNTTHLLGSFMLAHQIIYWA